MEKCRQQCEKKPSLQSTDAAHILTLLGVGFQMFIKHIGLYVVHQDV